MRRLVCALGVLSSLLGASAPAAAARAGRRAPPRPFIAHSASSLSSELSQYMGWIGGDSSAWVVDLNARRSLYADLYNVARLPASVEKVYTTSTALLRFGPDAKLTTSVLGTGWLGKRGVWHGTLYLKGGGDPTFGSASFDASAYGGTGATVERLASRLRHSGIKSVVGRVLGDESYFDSLRGTSVSGYQFDPDIEGSLSALVFNRGLYGDGYVYHPAAYAAQQLVSALQGAGVHVSASTGAATTPSDAELLAQLDSPSISKLIALTNTPSDNFFAEMLLKGLGARFGAGGSTAAGAGVVRAFLARQFGIHPQLVDGSGLSRSDATSPQQVVIALTKLRGNRSFWNSLAVGGQSGTLADEMQGTAAQGNCHGKTGTLHDVANLVGYCRARNGHLLAFAVLANGISDPAYVHSVEGNDIAVALAGYAG